MISTANYFDKIKEINFSDLPPALQSGHQFVIKATENGKNWDFYHAGEKTKNAIDTYFSKLSEFLDSRKVAESKDKEEDLPQKVSPTKVTRNAPRKTSKSKRVKAQEEEEVTLVERLPDELRFIRRYISLHGKTKSKEDFLPFINSLQRAIIERKIRKTSPYAKEIEHIQERILDAYHKIKKPVKIQIAEKVLKDYKELVDKEKVLPSVRLIKRYISLNGKFGVKEKAKKLFETVKAAVSKKVISKSDKYWSILDRIYKNLQDYKDSKKSVLEIAPSELSGINGALSGCGCELNGVEESDGIEDNEPIKESPKVMSSMDFSNMKFSTIGFTGKYRDLIGDPAKGFTAMVFGRPKMGKSFLCVDFAGYLARNHGKTLYVAKEEGLDLTLQEKLKAKDVAHPNLFVAEEIPANLGSYDFVFLDSVNKLSLSVKDLAALKTTYPQTAFIYIFQTTKQGNFRGANEFQHDVDIVIEVPEKGKAVQFGRFNQGGEMSIFSESPAN